jgi:hypothetical protein
MARAGEDVVRPVELDRATRMGANRRKGAEIAALYLDDQSRDLLGRVGEAGGSPYRDVRRRTDPGPFGDGSCSGALRGGRAGSGPGRGGGVAAGSGGDLAGRASVGERRDCARGMRAVQEPSESAHQSAQGEARERESARGSGFL